MAQNEQVGTAGARIGFICMAAQHLHLNGAPVDHLTIHHDDWAYCPCNVRATGHDWKPTGGVSIGDLESLVRGMRERTGASGNGHSLKKAVQKLRPPRYARFRWWATNSKRSAFVMTETGRLSRAASKAGAPPESSW